MKKALFFVVFLGLVFCVFGEELYVEPNREYGLYYEERNGTIIITVYLRGDVVNIVIPETINGLPVVAIGDSCFSADPYLKSVSLPNCLVSIGILAFSSCGLTNITLPDSLTHIGIASFRGNELTSVIIPHSVIEIGGSAFANNKLTEIVIPNGVKTIGPYAFSGNQLTSVVIPNSVTYIGENAFDEGVRIIRQ